MASCRITYVCIIIYKQSYHRFIFSLLSVFSLIPLIVVRLKRLFVQTYYPFYSRWVIYLSARFLLLPMETNGRSLSDIFIHLYIYISPLLSVAHIPLLCPVIYVVVDWTIMLILLYTVTFSLALFTSYSLLWNFIVLVSRCGHSKIAVFYRCYTCFFVR